MLQALICATAAGALLVVMFRPSKNVLGENRSGRQRASIKELLIDNSVGGEAV
jgi:hypothetical protein